METLFHIEMISEYFIENRDRMIDSNGYFSITIVVYFIHDALERDGFVCLFIGVLWDFAFAIQVIFLEGGIFLVRGE